MSDNLIVTKGDKFLIIVETPDEPEPPQKIEEDPQKNLARLLEKVEGCSVRS